MVDGDEPAATVAIAAVLAAELVAGAEVLLRDVNKGLLPLEGFNISATLDQKGSFAVIYMEPKDDKVVYS